MMESQQTIAVFGATGATGRLLVAELLARGVRVRAVARSATKMREVLPEPLRDHAGLTVVEASVSELSDAELADYLHGCSAAASCLGHTLSFRGIYGKPRRLVTDTARRVCDALAARATEDAPARFVLMCSAGVRHRGQPEPVPLAQRAVLALLRLLVPPHADNEHAAEHLRTRVDPDGPVRWAVVRPDTLTDHDAVTPYDTHPAPTRSAIFNPGKTHRINVAHFIADLLTDPDTSAQWAGRMPVLYNKP
ncbi:SDR family oxidoreductase [Phycisphaeraceae bacterium D3-23]